MIRRPGATLLELVVVVAITAVLAGLLLAGVQKVRTAADRLRCANNLRQTVLAAHMHHDAAGEFPAGVRADAAAEPYPLMSWLTRLLPHLDQQPLWASAEAGYRANRSAFHGVPPHPARDTVVPVLTCPADDRVRVPWVVPVIEPEFRVAFASYLGSYGTDYQRPTGVLYQNSRVRLVDVADGSGQTLFAGERPPSVDLIYGWWYAGAGQAGTGSLDSALGVRERNASGRPGYATCDRGPFHFTPGRFDDHCDVFHFWSPHPGGANFAFCDGSVRFLPYSADPVLPALATRAGGEVVAVPD